MGLSRSVDRARLWLIAALAMNVAICGATIAGLSWAGESPRRAWSSTAPAVGVGILRPGRGTDSWTAMAIAYERFRQDPATGLYAPFFEEGVKFQYPPSSLLLLDPLPESWVGTVPDSNPSSPGRRANGRLRAIAGIGSMAATLATLALSIVLFEWARWRTLGGPLSAQAVAVRVGVAALLGGAFYPLVKAHELGQLQALLNALVAAAILAFVLDRPRLCGGLLAACALLKPQFALVVLWAVARSHWPIVVGFVTVIAAGLAASLVRFGLQAHVDYVFVLRAIGTLGEVYWPNQSFNGLLNRLLLNGDPLVWQPRAYAPFNLVVYLSTVTSSLALLALALWWRRRPDQSRPAQLLADFLIVILVTVIASPVAWEHHYGVLLPVLAVSVPFLMDGKPVGRWTGLGLLLVFGTTANVLLRPELIFANRWIGIAGSHLLFGALTALVLLYTLRTGPLEESTVADFPTPVEWRRTAQST